MKKIILVVLIIILIISSFYIWNFFKNENEESNFGVLKGKVILTTGSCGPTICGPEGCPKNLCLSEGVKRKISIREPKQFEIKTFPFFYNNNSDLIKTIESNNSGDFSTILPIGNYSIFVVENGTGYPDFQPFRGGIFNEYCGMADMEGLNCLVEIKKNQTTEFDLKISFAAV